MAATLRGSGGSPGAFTTGEKGVSPEPVLVGVEDGVAFVRDRASLDAWEGADLDRDVTWLDGLDTGGEDGSTVGMDGTGASLSERSKMSRQFEDDGDNSAGVGGAFGITGST